MRMLFVPMALFTVRFDQCVVYETMIVLMF